MLVGLLSALHSDVLGTCDGPRKSGENIVFQIER